MEKQYFALYREGREKPLGALTEDTAESVMNHFARLTNKNYWLEPVTEEEARKITTDMTRLSEGLEFMFNDRPSSKPL